MKQSRNVVVLLVLVAAASISLVLKLQRTPNNPNSLTPHSTSASIQVCRVDILISTDAIEEAYKKGEAIYSQLEVARAVGERRKRELMTVVGLLEENGLSTEKGDDCLQVDIGFIMPNSVLRQMEGIYVKDYTGKFIPYTLWLEKYPSSERKRRLERLGYEIQLDPISPQQLLVAAGKWRVPAEKQRGAVEAEKARRQDLASAAKARAAEQDKRRAEQEERREIQYQKDLRERSLANCDAFETRVKAGQSTLTSDETEKYLSKCQAVRSGKLHDIWQKQ